MDCLIYLARSIFCDTLIGLQTIFLLDILAFLGHLQQKVCVLRTTLKTNKLWILADIYDGSTLFS